MHYFHVWKDDVSESMGNRAVVVFKLVLDTVLPHKMRLRSVLEMMPTETINKILAAMEDEYDELMKNEMDRLEQEIS